MIHIPDAAYAELLAAARDAQGKFAAMTAQVVMPKYILWQMAERLEKAIAAVERVETAKQGGGR